LIEEPAKFNREGDEHTELRQRGRMAKQLAKEFGYASYQAISYLDLE
jgi:hypothetical protein